MKFSVNVSRLALTRSRRLSQRVAALAADRIGVSRRRTNPDADRTSTDAHFDDSGRDATGEER